MSKKVSVTKDSTDIDYMTMQPRGDSAAASISYAELQVLSGNNLVATSRELFKSRGGDAGAWSATQAQLEATGKTSQVTTDKFSSGVESSKTLHAWLIATHRRNNI